MTVKQCKCIKLILYWSRVKSTCFPHFDQLQYIRCIITQNPTFTYLTLIQSQVNRTMIVCPKTLSSSPVLQETIPCVTCHPPKNRYKTINARSSEIYRVEEKYLASRNTVMKKVTCANDGSVIDIEVLGQNCKLSSAQAVTCTRITLKNTFYCLNEKYILVF